MSTHHRKRFDREEAALLLNCYPSVMQKQSVWFLWIGAILAMVLTSGWIALIGRIVFGFLFIAHLIEFIVKRDVFTRAGGSMGHHFVQTMIYGLFHWKPIEEGLGEASGD